MIEDIHPPKVGSCGMLAIPSIDMQYHNLALLFFFKERLYSIWMSLSSSLSSRQELGSQHLFDDANGYLAFEQDQVPYSPYQSLTLYSIHQNRCYNIFVHF